MKNINTTPFVVILQRQPRLQFNALRDFPYLREPLLEVDLPCQ